MLAAALSFCPLQNFFIAARLFRGALYKNDLFKRSQPKKHGFSLIFCCNSLCLDTDFNYNLYKA